MANPTNFGVIALFVGRRTSLVSGTFGRARRTANPLPVAGSVPTNRPAHLQVLGAPSVMFHSGKPYIKDASLNTLIHQIVNTARQKVSMHFLTTVLGHRLDVNLPVMKRLAASL